MKNTPQTDTQSVWQHGESVWEHTKRLIAGEFEGFRIPEWLSENHRYIVNNLHHFSTVKAYNIYHDCGKPFCYEIDEQGRRHFPNHAEVSKQTFLKYFDDLIAAELIGYDMALHVDTADRINSYEWDKKTAFTLLITALAEVHSNAAMFGGIESNSFKAKWKKINQRGKMLMKQFPRDEKHPYSYCIVRRDLINAQKAVQGTHAAIEHFAKNDYDFHPSVIYVVVKNEKKLQSVSKQLLDLGIDFSIFREPDKNDELTAICTEPLYEGSKEKQFMNKFMLWHDKM